MEQFINKNITNELTNSMIVSPSTILLQPHVGGFHSSDQEKISISSQLQETSLAIKWGYSSM